jgi:hypothetical protein
MDYLVRDSYYTGVAYGVVDNIRLVQGLDLYQGDLVITEKGIIAAEYLLFSRFLMYPTVYNHHTSRIAQLMFLRALEYLIQSNSDVDDVILLLRKMDDAEINIAMRNASGYPKEIIEMVNNRRLFKRALYTKVNKMEESIVEELSEERKQREIEEEISRKAGIDHKYVILDVQKREMPQEKEAKVLIGNDLVNLGTVSNLVRMLGTAFQENCKIGVYTPGKYRDGVKRAVEGLL